MIKSIFSPMTASTFNSTATVFAVKLAKTLNGQLCVYFMRPDPRFAVPYIGDGLTADVIQTLCDATEKEGLAGEVSASIRLKELCSEMALRFVIDGDEEINPDIPCAHMESIKGFLKEKVGGIARVADLAVVPQPTSKNAPDGEDMLNEVIFGSGRPLMMVPEGATKLTGSTVMIAWNGRAESARVVAASLPLLHEASKIYAITVGEDYDDRPNLQKLCRYLKIHNLEMEAVNVRRTSDSIGKTLLEHADKHGVDILISGAYSHSRLREKILGGVTKYLIHNTTIPIFLSH